MAKTELYLAKVARETKIDCQKCGEHFVCALIVFFFSYRVARGNKSAQNAKHLTLDANDNGARTL